MAVYFPTNRAFGPWAFNAQIVGVSGASPTEMYYYPTKAGRDTLFERNWGFRSSTGTITDGKLLDAFQSITGTTLAVFSSSNPVLETDDDEDSPYRGELRLKFTMA